VRRTTARSIGCITASEQAIMNEALLKQAGLVEEDVIAVDATGFRPTNTIAYSQMRRGKPLRECCGRQQSNDCAWRWAEFCRR